MGGSTDKSLRSSNGSSVSRREWIVGLWLLAEDAGPNDLRTEDIQRRRGKDKRDMVPPEWIGGEGTLKRNTNSHRVNVILYCGRGSQSSMNYAQSYSVFSSPLDSQRLSTVGDGDDPSHGETLC